MIISFDIWHSHTGIGFTLAILEYDEYYRNYLTLTSQFKIFGREIWNFDRGWMKEVETS